MVLCFVLVNGRINRQKQQHILLLWSGKGRVLLLMYAMFLAMNHPMTNIHRNINIMSQSITCGQEMALNETKDLIKTAVAPMQGRCNTTRHVGIFSMVLNYILINLLPSADQRSNLQWYFFLFHISWEIHNVYKN